MNPEKIGAAIRMLRTEAGYTQSELAECLSVTDKAVSKWERGISVPDISIVTQLSNLLNCDVDNLLEGNIIGREKTWQGLLLLKEGTESISAADFFGKPLVEVMIGYFLLAGIGDIWVSGSGEMERLLRERLGDGSPFGFHLRFLEGGRKVPPQPGNTMVVRDHPFVYGPFLTRCFHRAMARGNGVSTLVIEGRPGTGEKPVSFDRNRRIRGFEPGEDEYYALPILFYPKSFFGSLRGDGQLPEGIPLYAEPLDNGVIGYRVTGREAALDTAVFFRLMKERMGKEIYDLGEIARRRHFLS